MKLSTFETAFAVTITLIFLTATGCYVQTEDGNYIETATAVDAMVGSKSLKILAAPKDCPHDVMGKCMKPFGGIRFLPTPYGGICFFGMKRGHPLAHIGYDYEVSEEVIRIDDKPIDSGDLDLIIEIIQGKIHGHTFTVIRHGREITLAIGLRAVTVRVRSHNVTIQLMNKADGEVVVAEEYTGKCRRDGDWAECDFRLPPGNYSMALAGKEVVAEKRTLIEVELWQGETLVRRSHL